MGLRLHSIGHYISPLGGAPNPYTISPGILFFEFITAGSVYSPMGKTVKSGTVFIHQAGDHTVHQSDSDESYECLTVQYHHDTIPTERDPHWPREFRWDSAPAVVKFAHEMLYAFHQGDADREILGAYLWNTIRFRLDQFTKNETPKAVPLRMQRVIQYLDSYYAQDINIEEIANVVGLSSSHLHSRFKSALKMSPHQYIIRKRMRTACHQLVSTTMSVHSIAQEVGYKNTETFCRTFKKHMHCTAAHYRKQYTRHVR